MWLFRGIMLLLMLSLTGNIALGVFVTWQYMSRELPDFYALSSDSSTNIRMIPAKHPFVTDDIVINFAQQASMATTTLNFFNYEKAIEATKIYFTDDAFDEFKRALKLSGELQNIIDGRLVSTGVVSSIPVITKKNDEIELISGKRGLLNDDTWLVDVPMIINYEGAGQLLPREVVVRLMIGRVSTTKNKQGILVKAYFLLKKKDAEE